MQVLQDMASRLFEITNELVRFLFVFSFSIQCQSMRLFLKVYICAPRVF